METKLKDHFFWKYATKANGIFSMSKDVLYERIQTIMSYSNVFFLLLMFIHLFSFNSLTKTELIDPLWPMIPFKWLSSFQIVTTLQIALVVIFSILNFKSTRLLRILAFVSYFLYAAFANSFGKINHIMHFPLILLFCFALIPDKKEDNYKTKTILIFASAQFLLLAAYTLTGLWKLFWGILQLIKGEISIFNPLSFRNIMFEQFQNSNVPLLGQWFMDNYIFGWVCFWVVLYIELFSIRVFFKGKLHKVWGLFLILMHVALAMIMNVNMYTAPLVIGLLLVVSPFNQEASFKSTIMSLPIISLFKKLTKNTAD